MKSKVDLKADEKNEEKMRSEIKTSSIDSELIGKGSVFSKSSQGTIMKLSKNMKTSLKTALEVLDYGSNFLPETEEIGFENIKNNTNFFKNKSTKITADQLENKKLKNKKDVFMEQSKDILSNKEWGSTTNIMGTGGFNNVMKIPLKENLNLKTDINMSSNDSKIKDKNVKGNKFNFSSLNKGNLNSDHTNTNGKNNSLKSSILNTDSNNYGKHNNKNSKLPLINKKVF